MVKNISIVYGSTTGNTEDLANTIAIKLKNPNFNITLSNAKEISTQYSVNADLNIWCSSTWGVEPACLQDDFEIFLTKINLQSIADKTFLVFALGDRYYPHFAYAADILQDFILKNKGNLFLPPLKLQDPFELQLKEIDDNLIKAIKWLGV